MGTPVLQMEADYRYDVFGNRTVKSVDSDGTGAASAVATRYAYDDWNPAKPSPIGTENHDVWAEFTNAGSLTTRYIYGDAIDDLLARIDGGTPYWYLKDHLGSIRKVTDGSGVVKDSIVYDAFGNITSETDANYRGHYAWTSREIDVETGLQFNRARYYDPMTARWISQDPLGFDAGDSNLYRYVMNRATTAADPSGLQLSIETEWQDYLTRNSRTPPDQLMSRQEWERFKGYASQDSHGNQPNTDPKGVRRREAELSKQGIQVDRQIFERYRGMDDLALRSLQRKLISQQIQFRTDFDFALMSAAVYQDEGDEWKAHRKALEKSGWNVVDLKGFQEIQDNTSGFGSVAFENKAGQVVLVFRGTDMWELIDWRNNFKQGLGVVAEQYERAIARAGKFKDQFGSKLMVSGHSLGGGLATASSIVHNLKGVTFNSAGVNPKTVLRHQDRFPPTLSGKDPVLSRPLGDPNKLITAYRVDGEILSSLQDGTGRRLQTLTLGQLQIVSDLMPNSNGKLVTLPATSSITFNRHKMSDVISGMMRAMNDLESELSEVRRALEWRQR